MPEKPKNQGQKGLQANESVHEQLSKKEQLPKKKLSYKEQREFDSLPATIERLESQQKAIAQELADGSLYARDARRAAELTAKNAALEDEWTQAMQRWELLSA